MIISYILYVMQYKEFNNIIKHKHCYIIKLDHSSSETLSTSSFSSNSSSLASSVASSGSSSYPWLCGSTSKISFVAYSGTSTSFMAFSCKGDCSSVKTRPQSITFIVANQDIPDCLILGYVIKQTWSA